MNIKDAFIKRITVTLTAVLLLSVSSHAQHVENDALTYQAYLANNSVSEVKTQWEQIVAIRQKEFNANQSDKNLRFRLVLAQYGLLSATMRDEDEDLFDKYVDETEEHLEVLIKQNKNWGEPKAVLSGLLGLKMAYSPWKGMILGSKSGNLIEKAVKESPSSPLVNKFYGNSKLFTPEMWGGDVQEAIKALEKSVSEYEQTKTNVNNWLYIDAVAFLGQAYVKHDEINKAIACYEKALNFEPSFDWVQFSLLPTARKKMDANK